MLRLGLRLRFSCKESMWLFFEIILFIERICFMWIYDFFFFYCVIVGFDYLFNIFDRVIVDSVNVFYFFYNIECMDENVYCIFIVVVGFNDDELDVEVKENILMIFGWK